MNNKAIPIVKETIPKEGWSRPVKNTIEVPLYCFPKEIQQLHEQIGNARQELRGLEREFRQKLHEFLQTLG